MTEFRENLLTRMIHLYGFEHKAVITFADMCERWEPNEWNDTCLETLVKCHEEEPLLEEEEED